MGAELVVVGALTGVVVDVPAKEFRVERDRTLQASALDGAADSRVPE